jgi:putative ABC transport system permease protein
MLEGILLEGFIYGIMALGVFITFRILDFPDMTVDGTFPMGAAITAAMITSGFHYSLALLTAMAGGLLAGSVTALIHIKLKIHNLLAGILTLTMLYSVNIRIMGNKANQAIVGKYTVFTWIHNTFDGFVVHIQKALGFAVNTTISEILFFFIVIAVMKLLLDLFFHTEMGLAMISMGDNPKMVITLGINDSVMKLIGVSLANGLVAVSGGFAAMFMGFGDINLGQGIIISGLAAVMIGEFVLRGNSMVIKTLRVIIGCVIYKGVMYLGRQYGYDYLHITANDLKLLTGLLLIICLAFTRFKPKKKAKGALS